jgi:hypothetical protein
MIQRQTFEATEQAIYSSGQRTTIDLPKSGYITHIDCLFRFNIQNLVGTTRVLAQDGFAKLFQSLRIRAAGSRNYYDITDGRQWFLRNLYNYRNQMGMGLPSQIGDAAVAATDYYFLLRIHWGYDFFNMYDTTGAIPAAELQDLVLEIVWNPITSAYASAVAGTDYNINASAMAMTVYELAFSGADKPSSIWPKGIPLPRVQAQVETVRAGFSNLGLEVDLPVGDTISQTVIFNEDLTTLNRQDGIGTTTQTGPTEIGVKFPRERATKWQMAWEQFKQLSKVQADVSDYGQSGATPGYNTNVPHVGAGILRWADVTGRSTGLDLTAAQQGDAKIGLTYAHDGANNGRVHLLHYMMGPGVAA